MFRFSVNAEQLAASLNRKAEEVLPRVRQEVELLSVSAHAFVIQYAQRMLTGFNLSKFLGPDGKNVMWHRVGQDMWVVELDESVKDIEEGHERRFMSWLLQGKNAHTAKDGSRYARIPMPKQQGTGAGKSAVNEKNSLYQGTIENALKTAKISLKKIEKDSDGSPKIGILHKVNIQPPGTSTQFPSLFSKPRTAEMSALSGLPRHEGIYHLQGLVVSQRKNDKGKVVREAVTFRTISSKHESEGRWFQKEQPGIRSLQAAHQYVVTQWEEAVKKLQKEFGN